MIGTKLHLLQVSPMSDSILKDMVNILVFHYSISEV